MTAITQLKLNNVVHRLEAASGGDVREIDGLIDEHLLPDVASALLNKQ